MNSIRDANMAQVEKFEKNCSIINPKDLHKKVGIIIIIKKYYNIHIHNHNLK